MEVMTSTEKINCKLTTKLKRKSVSTLAFFRLVIVVNVLFNGIVIVESNTRQPNGTSDAENTAQVAKKDWITEESLLRSLTSINQTCPSLLRDIAVKSVHMDNLLFGGHDIMNLTLEDVLVSNMHKFEVTRIYEKQGSLIRKDKNEGKAKERNTRKWH